MLADYSVEVVSTGLGRGLLQLRHSCLFYAEIEAAGIDV